MDRLKKIVIQGHKIYRGAYNYFRNNSLYSEEVFEVYRGKLDLCYHFFADIHSRISTGELFHAQIDFKITKDFVPSYVKIERSLGEHSVIETYTHIKQEKILAYSYRSNKDTQKININIPPFFHITSPAVCTSMIFLKSKKEKISEQNVYHLIQSYNNWEYEKAPQHKIIGIERVTNEIQYIQIGGHSVQASLYRLYDQDDSDDNKTPPALKLHISRHATIPYIIESDDGTQVQMKYFNNLDTD